MKICQLLKLQNVNLDLILVLEPLPKGQILDHPKLKEFADDNFEFDENSRFKFSNPVENTVGKRQITRYEQFLLFSQCFHKTCRVEM